MNKRGFSLYLTFMVTTIVFILVSGSYEISRISLDIGRSDAIDAIVFHAAEGGLERGLARLNSSFLPQRFSYSSNISQHRRVIVEIESEWAGTSGEKNRLLNLYSTAILFEGNNIRGRRKLSRVMISNLRGRTGIGRFVEAT